MIYWNVANSKPANISNILIYLQSEGVGMVVGGLKC